MINKNAVFASVMATVVYVTLGFFGHRPSPWQLIALLPVCYPWKIGSNTYSLFGGFSEGNIYSLFGVIQDAGKDANCFIGLLYQRAGGNATQIAGISLYQKAGKDATQFFGISSYQIADAVALQCIGVMFCQESVKSSAGQVVGLSTYQKSRHRDVCQIIGIAIWQDGHLNAGQGFGVVLCQKAETVSQAAGISFWQDGKPNNWYFNIPVVSRREPVNS